MSFKPFSVTPITRWVGQASKAATDTETTDGSPAEADQPESAGHHPPTTEKLHDTIEARPYIEIRPADDAVDLGAVEQAMDRLERLLRAGTTTGLKATLTRSTHVPVVDWLLVADGAEDLSIRFLVGPSDPTLMADLRGILRTCFSDTYQLEAVEWHPRAVEADVPTVADPGPPPEDPSEGTGPHHPAITPDAPYVAGVEYLGVGTRHRDWQTPLATYRELTTSADDAKPHNRTAQRTPLASVIEAMIDARMPVIYQVVMQIQPDWTRSAKWYVEDLAEGTVTLGGSLRSGSWEQRQDYEPPPQEQARIDGIAERNPRRTLRVSARAVALTRADPARADAAARRLQTACGHLSGRYHELVGRVATDDEAHAGGSPPGRGIYADLCDRTVYHTTYDLFGDRLQRRPHRSKGIVVAPVEAASFCVLDGAGLTVNGRRALAATPGERTAMERPPPPQLDTYRGEGMLLGVALTQDDVGDLAALVLGPDLQTKHVCFIGSTGTGKTVALLNAVLSNAGATAGADILIDPKGDGMTVDYLMAHYDHYGTLENIRYFDCASVLPAISFFDIRDELEAGLDRTTAVEDKVDHYIEVLVQLMGQERFEQAVRSPDIIRYLVKAMFDPVNGVDAFSHADLHDTLRLMHERQATPTVSDPDLERMLAMVVANRPRTFDEIMQGVANRMEKVPVDRRLARIFNHVPEERGDPHFDLGHYLDEDVVIILDTGDLRREAQRVITLLILSELWTALRRRSRRSDANGHPLVNLYVEEAASVANSDLLTQFLSQSRGFDCSVTLSMQFPAQLLAHGRDVYDEVLNNIGTLVVGTVPSDQRLAERLATDDMDAQQVASRLRALRRGQWLVKLPARFGEEAPRPFLVTSAPPPSGHPESDDPFTPTQRAGFDVLFDIVCERTLADAGLTLAAPSTVEDADTVTEDEALEDSDADAPRLDTALPYTRRLPATVRYDADSHALRCTECDNRYDPSIEGMTRGIECCGSLDDIDRDDVPICQLNLKLSPEERRASEWADRQLRFLQAVYNAQQLRYQSLGYDLLWDSMIRLQEYVGIDSDGVADLIDADLLRHDGDHPHRLFTVTAAGRTAIGESQREGVDFGHASGDLGESSLHALMVEVARLYLEHHYAADEDSPVTEVVPYYELDDQHRLDVVGLDEDGEIRVAVEAERVNNDILRAVPDDFDKMAACEPDEAIWVVTSQADGHDVLQALNNPPEGDSRVEKSYASSTPTQQFRIDSPGLTAMYPVEYLRDRLAEWPPGRG